MRISERPAAKKKMPVSENPLAIDSVAYREAVLRVPRNAPYVLEYSRGDQRVTFFGCHHIKSPDDPQIPVLRSSLEEFLKKVPKEHVLLMIEGMHGDGSLKVWMQGIETEEQALKKFGEGGAVIWAASKLGLDVTSPEASEPDMVQELIRGGYKREDIALCFVLREFTTRIGRAPNDPRDEKFRHDSLMHFAKDFYHTQELTGVGWIKEKRSKKELMAMAKHPAELEAFAAKVVTDFIQQLNQRFQTLPRMKGRLLVPSMEALLNRDVTQIPIQAINTFFDPAADDQRKAVTNIISARIAFMRDQYLIKRVAEAAEEKKSIFVLFGKSHAVAIEPALKKYFTAK